MFTFLISPQGGLVMQSIFDSNHVQPRLLLAVVASVRARVGF